MTQETIEEIAERVTVKIAKICGCSWESCTTTRNATKTAIVEALQARDERATKRDAKALPRKLTAPELNHLLELLESRRESGSYFGPRDQYYARTERLIEWGRSQLKGE